MQAELFLAPDSRRGQPHIDKRCSPHRSTVWKRPYCLSSHGLSPTNHFFIGHPAHVLDAGEERAVHTYQHGSARSTARKVEAIPWSSGRVNVTSLPISQSRACLNTNDGTLFYVFITDIATKHLLGHLMTHLVSYYLYMPQRHAN